MSALHLPKGCRQLTLLDAGVDSVELIISSCRNEHIKWLSWCQTVRSVETSSATILDPYIREVQNRDHMRKAAGL